MKKFIGIIVFGLIVLSLCWTCKPLIVYPIEPQIDFKSLVLSIDTDDLGNDIVKAVFTFKVIDGDGDVGLPDSGSYPGFSDLGNMNLFINMYKKKGSDFIEDTIQMPYKTPYLEPEGQDKSLVADFEITKEFTKGSLPTDTIIKFKCYLFDRQLNKSNIAETPEFPSDTLGTILAPEVQEE
jgi:hypothetical protein